LHQVVYDLQLTGIARWKKGCKRPGIFVTEIPIIPIRQLADWAMENPKNPGINLTARPNGTARIILSLPVKFHQAQNFKT